MGCRAFNDSQEEKTFLKNCKTSLNDCLILLEELDTNVLNERDIIKEKKIDKSLYWTLSNNKTAELCLKLRNVLDISIYSEKMQNWKIKHDAWDKYREKQEKIEKIKQQFYKEEPKRLALYIEEQLKLISEI